MARAPGYKTFWEMACDAATEHVRGGDWSFLCNYYFNMVVHDFWDRLFADGDGPKKIFSLSIGPGPTPEPVTRELVWRLVGAAYRPHQFYDVPEDWDEHHKLAAVPNEDYGGGVRDHLLKNLCLLEADGRTWIEANPNYGGLTGNTRSKGGKKPKYDFALQEFINYACGEISPDGKKVTAGDIKQWLDSGGADGDSPRNTPFPNCDDVFVQDDKLKWKDHAHNDHSIFLRSLQSYIVRVNKED